MTRARIILLLLALPCLGVAGFALQSYPFARFELGLGLLAYATLGLWRPHLLLFALPLWLALVNLAPWSGSMYLEDYDLVLAVSLGVFLATGRYALKIRLTRAQWWFLGLHAHFDKARQVLMQVSARLQAWAKEAAEQLQGRTVWRCVCDHLKHMLAGIGPPKALLTCGLSSGNCGF